ncbi:MAG: sigma 54-interacting transcriptional regulator [Deltaproteobacteria bacterium]|nr:sigma 54-interacting transcriptional regulator [Deltaproteobacteria bacterium]
MNLPIRSPQTPHIHYRRSLIPASFFEGEFNIDWLQELTREKTSQVLAALEFGVHEKWLDGKKTGFFYFTDSVVRQKLQADLSADQKKEMHRRIATLLLRELSEDPVKIQKVPPHLLFISNDLAGCRLLIEGGSLHRKGFRYEEARQCYDKAIEDLGRMKGEEADHLFIEAALHYSKFPTDDSVIDRTTSVIHEAMSRARRRKIKTSLALLEMNLARNEWFQSRFQSALRHFEKGWALAGDVDDPKIQRSVTIYGMFFHYWMGRYQEAVQSYEKFAPDVESFPRDNFPLLAALTAGACYGHCGHSSQALGMLHAIRSHSLKIGNLYIAGHAGVAIGELLLGIHHLEESKKFIEESLKETRQGHNLYAYLGGLTMLSYVYYLLKDTKRAFSILNECMEVSHRAQMPMRHGYIRLSFSWAMEEGKFPHHQALDIEKEIDLTLEGGNIFSKGIAWRYQALLQKRRGLPGREVIGGLKQSIKYLEASGHQTQLALSKIELARAYLDLKDERKARQWAEPAAKVLHSQNETLVPDDIRMIITHFRSGENLLEEILCLGQELVTIRDTRELFRRIISAANRITGAERGAIFLMEGQDPEKVILRAAKNITSEDISLPDFEPSMQVIRETFKTGQGRLMNLEDQDHFDSLEPSGIRSRIGVPMIIRDTVVGVLYHDNRLLRSVFKESDLNVLNYFAAQAAIAMDNAQAWKTLQDLYEKQQMEKRYYEEQYLESIRFEEFVGKSLGIKKVINQVEQVAGTEATVLILGETGVGKELVARSIHRRSPRGDKPFIRVHCSALPESLISSELFGHEKGAFTDAISRQIGRFELAHGGTLFLDEIGDISMEIQVKLLRVLQTREFERVGGQETVHSDFRLLAATNRDLLKEVKAGRFREDLYYRINVFPIQVPPLRERKEDIPLLAHHFLEILANKLAKPMEKITRQEREKLLAYDWPGNVRELENVIERGVILSQGPYYKVPELGHHPVSSDHDDPSLSLRENERNYIIRVLKKSGGKITGPGGAAERLVIHPNTLYSRMKKLGIRRQPGFL